MRHLPKHIQSGKALQKSICVIAGLIICFAVSGFSQGVIIAHRGASSIAPENTIVSYQKAIEAGAGYIEIDLRMSKDDSIMVIHDETLDRTTNGTGKVKNFNYVFLKGLTAGYSRKFGREFADEKIPTLFEVLNLAKGSVNICIDIKNTPETPVIQMIDRLGMKNNVVLMSYNVEKLKRIKANEPEIKTVLIKNILSNIDIETAKEIEAFGVSGGYISPFAIIENAHKNGLQCWFGVVSDPAKAAVLFANNLDAVVTDYPQLMTMSKSDKITVFPNPFGNYLLINLIDYENVTSVYIVDINGKTVFKRESSFPPVLRWIPAENVKKGMFFIFVIERKKVFCKKVLFLR